MGDSKADWWRCGGSAMWGACLRLLGSLLGGIIAFAVWLVAVLVRMPRPPVPPSFAVTLTAPVVTAAGFGLGMLVAERLTRRRQSGFCGAYLWSLVGGTIGTLAMFPLGGMMAGFGLFALGTAALLIREVMYLRYLQTGRGHS
ncbi:MAG: hypothetical protein LAP85_24865 [Acidobacteriia bacterium]|nr:hypothetical protein [Terriglobia bacterium]